MSGFIKYPLVLGIVAAVSGAALYGVNEATKDRIAANRAKKVEEALGTIFFDGYGAYETIETSVAGDGGATETVSWIKIWKGEETSGPADWFAATGEGIGYNSGSPVRLVAAFANPDAWREYDRSVLVGWSVIASEETPGLGEKIKDSAASNTIAGMLTGAAASTTPDRRTAFQKQFFAPDEGRVYTADELALAKDGGPVDAITGATYTTVGVIDAIKDAAARIERARAADADVAAETSSEETP